MTVLLSDCQLWGACWRLNGDPEKTQSALPVPLLDYDIGCLLYSVRRNGGVIRREAPKGNCIVSRSVWIGLVSCSTHHGRNKLPPLLSTEIIGFGQRNSLRFSTAAANGSEVFREGVGIWASRQDACAMGTTTQQGAYRSSKYVRTHSPSTAPFMRQPTCEGKGG